VTNAAEAVLSAPEVRRTQRRVVSFLVVVQLLSGIGNATGIALGALVAAAVSGSDTIGGLAATASVIGIAVAAMPLARVAQRFGRRPSLSLGFACGALGAAIVAVAIRAGQWPLLLFGMLLFGFSSAAGYAGRYAATDLAEPSRRASQLALVVWPGTVGVVLGPNLADTTQRLAGLLGMTALSGPFLFAGLAFAAAALLVQVGLRPDPLRLARALAADAARAGVRASNGRSGWWPVETLRGSMHVRWALAGIALNHAAMIAIMVMTPLDMREQHSSISVIGMVISGHLAGMFVLSPVFGWLSDRYGSGRLLVVGTLATATAAVLMNAGAGGRPALIGGGLFLLGLGWSCSVVAGSSLLTEHAILHERPAVQGLNDVIMDVLGAGASVGAGLVATLASFGVLTAGVAGLTALVLLAMAWSLRGGRPVQPAPAGG
jgi:MFS family permease